jgi:hypothetical protein
MEIVTIIMILLGIGILVTVSIDIFLTVIHFGGGGILSKPFCDFLWKVTVVLSGRNPRSSFLVYSGALILVLLFFFWVLLIWTGFGLIYLSDVKSVVETNTEINTNTFGKIYYVGYVLTSLGNGDLKSGSDFWKIMTNLMGIASLFFVSLSISYLLPVLQAVISKRTLARYIHQMGRTPEEIILNGWNGEDFSQLYQRITSLETMIIQHSERHLAYPILHFFHSNLPEYSAPLNLAKLDEAITIMEVYELDKSNKTYHWQMLRKSMDDFITKVQGYFVEPTSDQPPFRYNRIVSEFSKESLSDNLVAERLKKNSERRRVMKGLIEKDLWEWEDMTRSGGTE